jgi:predicted ATPase
MRRKQLHRCLAETLERRYQGRVATAADRLAYHYEQAGVLDKALENHLLAGDTARQQLAYEAAISHYQKALVYLKALHYH